MIAMQHPPALQGPGAFHRTWEAQQLHVIGGPRESRSCWSGIPQQWLRSRLKLGSTPSSDRLVTTQQQSCKCTVRGSDSLWKGLRGS